MTVRYTKPGEYYEIIDYQVDKQANAIYGHMMHAQIIDGSPEFERLEFGLQNSRINGTATIDPNWKNKPEGFMADDPSTWNGLSWDDVPKILPTTEDYNTAMEYVAAGKLHEEAIFMRLMQRGRIPAEGFEIKIT